MCLSECETAHFVLPHSSKSGWSRPLYSFESYFFKLSFTGTNHFIERQASLYATPLCVMIETGCGVSLYFLFSVQLLQPLNQEIWRHEVLGGGGGVWGVWEEEVLSEQGPPPSSTNPSPSPLSITHRCMKLPVRLRLKLWFQVEM